MKIILKRGKSCMDPDTEYCFRPGVKQEAVLWIRIN
jgi:hypothetical protein